MKKLLKVFLSLLLILTWSTTIFASDPKPIIKICNKNGITDISSNFNTTYFNSDYNLMIPARDIFKELGYAKIVWDKKNKVITAYKEGDDHIVGIIFDGTNFIGFVPTNGDKTTLVKADVLVTLNNNAAMIGIQDLPKFLDYTVKYDIKTTTYYIIAKDSFLDKTILDLPDAAEAESSFQSMRAIGIDPWTQTNLQKQSNENSKIQSNQQTSYPDLKLSMQDFMQNTSMKNAYSRLACDVIKTKLKYPNTATFVGTPSVSRFDDSEDGHATVNVRGYVKSQTGIGILKEVPFYVTFDITDRTIVFVILDDQSLFDFRTNSQGELEIYSPSYSLEKYL